MLTCQICGSSENMTRTEVGGAASQRRLHCFSCFQEDFITTPSTSVKEDYGLVKIICKSGKVDYKRVRKSQ